MSRKALDKHLSQYSSEYYDGDIDEWWAKVRGSWSGEISNYPVEQLGSLGWIWVNQYHDVSKLEKRYRQS